MPAGSINNSTLVQLPPAPVIPMPQCTYNVIPRPTPNSFSRSRRLSDAVDLQYGDPALLQWSYPQRSRTLFANPPLLAILQNRIRNALASPGAIVNGKKVTECRLPKPHVAEAVKLAPTHQGYLEKPWRERGLQVIGISPLLSSLPTGFPPP